MKNYVFFFLLVLLFIGCKNPQEEIMPPTISISYDSIVAYGGNAVAKWSVINATSVTCNGVSVNSIDSLVLKGIKENVIITIIAKGEGGTAEKSKTISVNYPIPTLVIECDTTLNYGDSTTLKWSTTFANAVIIDGVYASLSGTREFNQLLASEKHKIEVLASGGLIEKTININVGDWTTSNLGLLTHSPWKLESIKYFNADGTLYSTLNLSEEQLTNYYIYSINGKCKFFSKDGQPAGGCDWRFLPDNKILEGDQKRDIYLLDKDHFVERQITQNGYIYQINCKH